MKKLLLILCFAISSLKASQQEMVLQVPIAETNFCIALHNEIKASSNHVIQSYRHPRYDRSTVFSGSSDQLFSSCLHMYNNNHRNTLAPVSQDQLHSMIFTMTRSADSSYQEVAVANNLSPDALGKCLRILNKKAILTTSNNYPCPHGYATVRYHSNATLDLEPMDLSE